MEEGAGIRKEGSDEECDEVSDGRRHQKKVMEENEDRMVQVTEEDGRGKEGRGNGEDGGTKGQKKTARKEKEDLVEEGVEKEWEAMEEGSLRRWPQEKEEDESGRRRWCKKKRGRRQKR